MKILTTTVKCMLVMSFINAYTAKSQTIDYFGQTPPGDKAIEFAPGTFSRTDRLEAKIVFSPDGNECYYEIAEFKNNDFIYKIYFTKRENNTWTEQEEAPFSVNSSVELSCMSADGKKIYIVKENDIWMVDRTESGWGEPKKLLSPVNSSSIDGGYSETSDSVGYIFSNRRGVFGDNLDIWRIRHVNDTSLLADNLGYGINTINMEVTPCIAPDGSYLIFARSVNGSFKLFICFDTGNGEWTTPINMDLCGAGINTQNQVAPTISPDGKYLFFNRHSGDPVTNVMDIYWVALDPIIESLKDLSITTIANSNKNDLSSQVYPIPASQVIQIKNYNSQPFSGNYKIMSMNGKILRQGSVESEQIDVSFLNKGIYLLILNEDDKYTYHKIIIK